MILLLFGGKIIFNESLMALSSLDTPHLLHWGVSVFTLQLQQYGCKILFVRSLKGGFKQ